MIVVQTNRTNCILTRTNRRVRWMYADYQGRYETVEKAIAVAKERLGDTPFEYRVETICGELITTGFSNWK